MTTIICHRTFLLKRHFQEVFVCRSSRAQHFSTSDVTIRYSAILFGCIQYYLVVFAERNVKRFVDFDKIR